MKKRGVILIVVLILSVFAGVFECEAVSAKKAEFITDGKYVGTYSWGGKEETGETGWFDVIINKISSNGRMEFQIQKGTPNGTKLYYTPLISATIKGNKAKFQWEDSWGCSGTGKIVFVKKKNKDKVIKVTITEKGSDSSALVCKKQVFKRISKDTNIMDD